MRSPALALPLAWWACEAAAPPRATPSGEALVDGVATVLEVRCGCHGVSVEALAAIEAEPANEDLLRWAVDEAGRIDVGARTALLEALADDWVRSRPGALLAAPLAFAGGGADDAHPEVFSDPADADFTVLSAWVDAIAPAAAAPAASRGSAQRFFDERVAPILMRKSCLGGNCHGPRAFNDLKLLPGPPDDATNRANRRRMLGASTRLVHLGGDVEQSKQLLKTIPLAEGGILHKGGNHFLEKGDPDYRVLVRWLELEAAEARARTGAELGRQDGIVFVRRPRATPERFFEDGAFLPGGDLIWSRDGRETNLTAALHPDGPADVRAPDVSYDGRRVVFAMRRGPGEPLNLWEIELGGGARQLTFGTAPDVHHTDPLYAPDPADPEGDDLSREVLLLTSNRAGATCPSSPPGLLGEADGGDRLRIDDAQRTERAGALEGRRLEVVRGTNTGAVRAVRRSGSGWLEVDRPLPAASDATTHYVVAAEVRMAPCYDGYRMRLAPAGGERAAFEDALVRMTWAGGQTRRPTLRSSGGPIFTFLRTGWQSGRPYFNGALFRVHVDGSDFHPHYGERSQIPILADDRELPSGLEVRIGRGADSYWGGTLLLSDHQFGPAIEPDNALDDLDHPYRAGAPTHALPRFFPGWIELEPESAPSGISPGGAWRDPYPLPDGSLLVAHARGPVDLDDPDAAPDFDVLRLVPEPGFQTEGTRPGRYRREVVVSGAAAELWPRPVLVRPKERLSAKILLKTDAELFGEPGARRGFRGFPPATPALLEIYDLPGVEHLFEQVTPTGGRHVRAAVCPVCGESMPEIEQVTGVRLVGWTPARGGRPGRRFVVAEGPLEADGSFQALLPSRTSFEVQALNPLGMAVSALRRWLYVHPGERHTLSVPRALFSQTCGGCHGGLTGRREDVLRRPDAITSASRTLAVWDADSHTRRAPRDASRPPAGGWPAATFEQDIRPLLGRRCVPCHAAPEPAAGLDLGGVGAYSALRALVESREGMAVRSYLLEKLVGRELHAPRALEGDRPHPSRQPLTPDELRTFVRWVDLLSPRGTPR